MPREPAEALGWLGDAIVRHLAHDTSRYYFKGAPEPPEPFEGINETALVVFLGKIFEGLGLVVSYEQKVYGDSNLRLDLWAGEPDESAQWYLEAKVIWDGQDHRLNRRRFEATQEILGDPCRLAECRGDHLRKAIVWVAFSPTESVERLGDERKTMRLGDAVDVVKTQCPTIDIDTYRCVDLGRFGPCHEMTRFAHIFCWRVS